MNILYLTLRDFPQNVANRLQTMKMADAFSKFANVDLTVSELHESKADIYDRYCIGEDVNIIELGAPRIKPQTLFTLPQIICAIYKKKYDFYFCREEYLAFILALLHVKFIYEIHDIFPGGFKGWILKIIIKRAKKVICISENIRSWLIKNYIVDSKKIVTIPLATDIDHFFSINITQQEARTSLSLPLNKKLLVYTGRFKKEKGVYIAIEAMAHLSDSYRLVLVGGYGNEEATINQYIKEKKLENKVIVQGYKPYKLIPHYTSAADALLLPNTTIEHSYSPLKLYEYLAARRPIIASNIYNSPEYLQEDHSFFFNTSSPKDLAKAIENALKSKEIIAKKLEKALMKSKSHTLGARAKEIVDFVNE